MIRWMLSLFCLCAVALRAEVPRLLQDALQKFTQDTDRWAYTQTLVEKDDKGRVKQETVVRFDPSQPYAQQYRPLKVGGKEPTESEVRKYRRQGEKRGDRFEREEREGPDPKRKSVGEIGRAHV